MQGHDTERIKIDERTWEVVCVQCGRTFQARRSDASFCSANHRVAFSKEPQKRLNALQRLKDIQIELSALTKKYCKDDEFFETMKAVQKTVAFCLERFEN